MTADQDVCPVGAVDLEYSDNLDKIEHCGDTSMSGMLRNATGSGFVSDELVVCKSNIRFGALGETFENAKLSRSYWLFMYSPLNPQRVPTVVSHS